MFSILKKTNETKNDDDSPETLNVKFGKVTKYTIPMMVVMVDGRTVNHEHSFQETENFTFLYASTPLEKPEGFDSVQVFKETFISEVMKNGLFVKRYWYHPNTIKYVEFGSVRKEDFDLSNGEFSNEAKMD